MNRYYLNWAGPYSSSATYCKGDVATSAGAGYVSISFPNTGNPLTDTAHWTPLGSLTDDSAWATLAHAAIVTINGGGSGGSKAVPLITWPAPAPITYGTALSSTQLNATANALGSFAYSQPLGTVLNAGIQTLTVTFTPTDSSVYVPATATVSLAVGKATPTITWPPPPSLLYTDALSSRQLNATASCPGTIAYTPASGSTLPLGTTTLTAVFTPSDLANYNPVTTTRSLTVTVTSPPPALVQSAPASATRDTAPITFTLPAAPTLGNQLLVLIGYEIYQDFDYLAPDVSWAYTVAGRGSGGYRTGIFLHTVVPGESAAFTFYPGPNFGGTPVRAVIVEVSGTVGFQSLFGSTPGQTNSQTMPSLVPSAAGALPLMFSYFTGDSSRTPPTGWTLLPAAGFAVATGPLAADNTTAIAPTWSGYCPGSLDGTLLFTPGALCATPAPSPAPGSTTAATQTVSLTCATSGATIFYTLDGSLPTTASPVYSGPFTFDRTTQLNVLATASGYAPSGVGCYTFVVAAGTPLGVGLDGNLNGYVPFASDLWHLDISAAPVDTNSAAVLTNLNGSVHTNLAPDQAIGFNVVDSTPGKPYTTPLSPLSTNISPAAVNYGGDYPTLVPMPANVYIEAQPPAGTLTGDNHAIVLDRGAAVLYELDSTVNYPPSGSRPTQFSASQLSIWDLTLPDTLQRPIGYTSASAGGNSIFAGIPRYDEVMAAIADGSMCLKHATRMTVANGYLHGLSEGSSCYAYFQLPATNGSNPHPLAITDPTLTPYGLRLRLKASFDASALPPVVQVLTNTWKKYGFIVDDIGYTFSWNLCADPRWDQGVLSQINIPSSNLEVLQRGTPAAVPVVGAPSASALYSKANYPHGTAPTINSFTASATSITLGQSVTLSATMTAASYGFIDYTTSPVAGLGNLPGLIRSGHSATWTPTARGTYTLNLIAQSPFLAGDDQTDDGIRPSATLTVTVT